MTSFPPRPSDALVRYSHGNKEAMQMQCNTNGAFERGVCKKVEKRVLVFSEKVQRIKGQGVFIPLEDWNTWKTWTRGTHAWGYVARPFRQGRLDAIGLGFGRTWPLGELALEGSLEDCSKSLGRLVVLKGSLNGLFGVFGGEGHGRPL